MICTYHEYLKLECFEYDIKNYQRFINPGSPTPHSSLVWMRCDVAAIQLDKFSSKIRFDYYRYFATKRSLRARLL